MLGCQIAQAGDTTYMPGLSKENHQSKVLCSSGGIVNYHKIVLNYFNIPAFSQVARPNHPEYASSRLVPAFKPGKVLSVLEWVTV